MRFRKYAQAGLQTREQTGISATVLLRVSVSTGVKERPRSDSESELDFGDRRLIVAIGINSDSFPYATRGR